MKSSAPSSFELPSARNLTVGRAVEMFVPTQLYWEVLRSDSNDVVFGTRGSGKTMLLRMMSVQHLVRFAQVNADALAALKDLRRLGVFVPLGIDWCVAFQRDDDTELRLFTDGLNLVALDSFAEALNSLVQDKTLGELSQSSETELCHAL